tara:strand:+ start:758 stop:967 length:210 start_codon:yes stop_codon:yes gene_type:complete
MELPGNSSCIGCKWLIVEFLELKCKAFIEGIPEVIISGEYDHRKPFKGDNGIQFEQANFKELEEAQFST